jgi:hypothetical protein
MSDWGRVEGRARTFAHRCPSVFMGARGCAGVRARVREGALVH